MKNSRPGEDRKVQCPSCGRPNPAGLIYCEDEDCAAVLHPERAACRECSNTIPANAKFCPECGRPDPGEKGGMQGRALGARGRRALEEMRRTLGKITGREIT